MSERQIIDSERISNQHKKAVELAEARVSLVKKQLCEKQREIKNKSK